MTNFKKSLCVTAAVAVMALAAQGVKAEDAVLTGSDTTVKTETTVAPEAGTETTTKTTTHKKHHGKHKVKESKVLNATPGDKKTSNDDSGMSGDAAAHGKVSESTTTDPASDKE